MSNQLTAVVGGGAVMTTKIACPRLYRLRELMRVEGLAGYIVPSGDAHQSEYIQVRDQRRAFISHFTGSAGLALVGLNQAWLWTDGRYWNQAGKELSSEWELMKLGLPDTPSTESFISKHFAKGSSIGADPTLLSIAEADRYSKELGAAGLHFNLLKKNLVDQVWAEERPNEDINKLVILTEDFSGRSTEKKLEWIRSELVKKKADLIVITALDDIAWLYNLRGSDIPYNPVFIAYATVSLKEAKLYINKEKTLHISDYFPRNGITTVTDYDTFFNDLEILSRTDANVWVDANSSAAVLHALKTPGSTATIFIDKSPITKEKALKNPVELEGTRLASLRDAAALVEAFAWLENEINQENHGLTEASYADVLLQFRKKQIHFINPSFATISSTGANASVIHYHPDGKNSSPLKKQEIFLCDSGGQYMNGTTDVTRTFHFGTPSEKEILCYTLVLKGVVSLSQAVFPNNTSGLQIDAFARRALWEHGLDYRHGTGHGVGHFLNVHEGPHQISFRLRAFDSPLFPNMIVTNEPGYYEDGSFGIRIENMLVVKEHKTKFNFQNTGFLAFETLTYVPFDYKLIDKSLLTDSEKDWINHYHKSTYDKIKPLLSTAESIAWLERYTTPI